MFQLFKLFKLFSFLVISNVNSMVLPLPGSTYTKTINFPLIGHQTIETEIVTDNLAYLTFSVLINERGTIRYINLEEYIKKKIINKKKLEKQFLNKNKNSSYNGHNGKNIYNDGYYIKLSYNLRKVINKYKVEFNDLYYDDVNDYILFTLHIKLINYKSNIQMCRKLND